MRKLKKLIKIPFAVFVLALLAIIILEWKDIVIDGRITDAIINTLLISFFITLGIKLILSIKSILKYTIIFILIISILSSYTDNPIDIIDGIKEFFQDEEDINGENLNRQAEDQEVIEGQEELETNEKLLKMENEMLDLVNQEREKNNLNKLVLDEELRNVARVKSEDIAANNYFDHNSPKYGSPFEMMDEFGIRYRQAAENLAGHQSVELAHEGLMNSQGHRENILEGGLTHIGIGIRRDEKYGYIFTQMFISKI